MISFRNLKAHLFSTIFLQVCVWNRRYEKAGELITVVPEMRKQHHFLRKQQKVSSLVNYQKQ
jgi:hypothetical protein